MKQLNESFQSQEIKDIIQNNEFFKYYIPEPFFTTPTLSNLAIFGEKHSNMLYYNIHYTIVKLYHTYLKLFNEETQDKFINTDTTAYFTKVLQLFNPRQYNKKQNINLDEANRVKIYRDINIYVKQLYQLLQQVINHSNYESTAVDLLFRKYSYSNFTKVWQFNDINTTINNIPPLTKYNRNDMNELTYNYNNRDFDIAFFYNNNKLTGIFNKTRVLITNINYLTEQYKKIYDILISNIKNIKIDVLTTLDDYNILYLTNLKTLFNKENINITNKIFNIGSKGKYSIGYQIGRINDIPYDYALISLNPKYEIRDSKGYYRYENTKCNIDDYGRKNNIGIKFNNRDYKKDSDFISNNNYNIMALVKNPISLSANIKFCKQCDIEYKDHTTGEIVHELLNTLDTAYAHYSGILNKYRLLYIKNQIKIKEYYDFNSAQKYVKYIGMYRNILEPLVQQVVDIMYTIKHSIPIDKKVLEDSYISAERRNIENLTMELDKYRARLLRFRNTVYSNAKIK